MDFLRPASREEAPAVEATRPTAVPIVVAPRNATGLDLTHTPVLPQHFVGH
ncbi:hypothetical protein [Streptomyces sp. NBC_01304]|uniref:hypothetical protein n=1 Tax=Streptomyces sp. NBC_01304 TaxID=2903818 RepID=UPI002E12AE0D|nr:hypothetical protein OG430_22755 [Streptomyces sp. NBC_01304]